MDVFVYVHPAVSVLTLGLCFWVFRDGYALRGQRLRRRPAGIERRVRHVRWAPWAVGAMVLSGFLGLASAVVLRGWKPFGTAHGLMAGVCLGLYVAVWRWGQRLVLRQAASPGVHGVLGLLALMTTGLTAILGIALLP